MSFRLRLSASATAVSFLSTSTYIELAKPTYTSRPAGPRFTEVNSAKCISFLLLPFLKGNTSATGSAMTRRYHEVRAQSQCTLYLYLICKGGDRLLCMPSPYLASHTVHSVNLHMNFCVILLALLLLTSSQGASQEQNRLVSSTDFLRLSGCPRKCHFQRIRAVRDCRNRRSTCSVTRCRKRPGRYGFKCARTKDPVSKVTESPEPDTTCSLSTTPAFEGYQPKCVCDDGSYDAEIVPIFVVLFKSSRCMTKCYENDASSIEQCNQKNMTNIQLDDVTNRCCKACGGEYAGFCFPLLPIPTFAPIPDEQECSYEMVHFMKGVHLRCQCRDGTKEEYKLAIVGGIGRTCIEDCLDNRINGDQICSVERAPKFVSALAPDIETCCRRCNGAFGKAGLFDGCGRMV